MVGGLLVQIFLLVVIECFDEGSSPPPRNASTFRRYDETSAGPIWPSSSVTAAVARRQVVDDTNQPINDASYAVEVQLVRCITG